MLPFFTVFFLQTHRYFQCKSSHLWFWNSTLHPTSKIPLYFVAYCFLISIVVNLKMNMIGMSTLVAPFYIIFLDSQTRLENKMRLFGGISMTSILVHTVAQPTKWRFLSKNFNQLVIFVIGLAFTSSRVDKNRAQFQKTNYFKKWRYDKMFLL